MFNLINGDCLEKLKELPDNSIDSIVTDPPYGLSFMGKKWDYEVPSIEIWKEALRVLKPGGHLLSFGGTRTYHRMVVNIEDAGFEIRDCIQWLYGSGFPKSHNIKEGDFKGWGTALKPANEPIVVARKLLEKGLTVAENVLKYGCGAINIDGSRIVPIDPCQYKANATRSDGKIRPGFLASGMNAQASEIGRWPANIILDEEAAQMLDEQSGHLKNGGQNYSSNSESMFGTNEKFSPSRFASDSGGASRFFYVAKASKSERNAGLEGMPKKKNDFQRASSGLSKSNNGRLGLEDNSGQPNENFHPTVKPIKLMQYIINLVTPPNGTVLDPFMGSGSTGVAAKNLNRKFIGIELDKEYFEIAKKRIESMGVLDGNQGAGSQTN